MPSLPFHISSFLFFGVWFSLVFSQIAFFFCSSLVTSFNWWIVAFLCAVFFNSSWILAAFVCVFFFSSSVVSFNSWILVIESCVDTFHEVKSKRERRKENKALTMELLALAYSSLAAKIEEIIYSEVDPIVASLSGGAIGVILALTVVEKETRMVKSMVEAET
ncbi:hypothetical protein RchiOBHm_Chr7g0197521 [Rosa chinensis]|uniref:Uncharacterized protein n=1 Tax=Rosa chinensis TaxID=74649 RepID=A0A2P6P6V4_ROSCH|nr:hypothetical protein RchiOBHm_Chr7g0197521 [Rosa chinensis]